MGVVFNPLIFSGFDRTSSGGGGGGVTTVTASGPLSSSGGTTPNISFTGTLAIANGGTGQTSASAALNALGGANQALSNLTSPTAVNRDLLPGSSLTFNLGSAANAWNKLFVPAIFNTSNQQVVDINAEKLYDTSTLASIDWQNRRLVSDTTIKLDWSGTNLDVNTRKIINVTNPTNPQDAATKNYVDTNGGITTLTGDVTAGPGSGSQAATLATVNGNVGSFGSSTSIPSFTVNAKGLITAASGNVVIAPAGTLSGTTLNSTVVSSSLTSVGTVTTGTWNATTIAINHGGTGQTTANTAFNALAPSQATHSGQFLTTNGSNTSWATVTASPAGADTQVQFNNAGVTAGDANFTWNTSTQKLGVNGTITDGDGLNIVAIDLTGGARQLYDSTGTGPSINFDGRILSLANGNDVIDWSDGNVFIPTLGTGLKIKSGTNAKIGTAVLVGGTVTVSNTNVTANSLIFITSQVDGGVPGFLRITAKTAATSFVITSSNILDTSTVAWNIIESIP